MPTSLPARGRWRSNFSRRFPISTPSSFPSPAAGCSAGAPRLRPSMSPSTRVIGVEPVESPDMRLSLAAGSIVACEPGATIADALRLHSPSEAGFNACRALIPADQIVLVTNEEIRDALELLCGRMKMVVEPAGAVALAAVLAGHIRDIGSRVAVIASGGNVGLAQLGQDLAGPLSDSRSPGSYGGPDACSGTAGHRGPGAGGGRGCRGDRTGAMRICRGHPFRYRRHRALAGVEAVEPSRSSTTPRAS